MAEPSKLLRFRPSRVLLHLKNSYKAAIFSQFCRFCKKFSHNAALFSQLVKTSQVPTWTEEFRRKP